MSGLRCWPGALAVVIRSTMGNEGREVVCLRYVRRQERVPEVCPRTYAFEDGWLVQAARPLRCFPALGRDAAPGADRVGIFPDTWLLPLRPGAAAEDTPTTADKPQPVEA